MGGHGGGVTKQLQYRRSQARKRAKKEKTYGSLKSGQWEDPMKATPEQLLQIKTKLRKQRLRKGLLRVIAFIGILFFLMLLLYQSLK